MKKNKKKQHSMKMEAGSEQDLCAIHGTEKCDCKDKAKKSEGNNQWTSATDNK